MPPHSLPLQRACRSSLSIGPAGGGGGSRRQPTSRGADHILSCACTRQLARGHGGQKTSTSALGAPSTVVSECEAPPATAPNPCSTSCARVLPRRGHETYFFLSFLDLSSSSLTGLCALGPVFLQRCPDRSLRDLFSSANSFLDNWRTFCPSSNMPASAALRFSSSDLNFSSISASILACSRARNSCRRLSCSSSSTSSSSSSSSGAAGPTSVYLLMEAPKSSQPM
mmetsp:Transcript_91181/g.282012  ORF Transcript_91181/g.282012 Transcript_91181/m.282012 type:complete len:226 (+) Transcript_91181:118-795(+)